MAHVMWREEHVKLCRHFEGKCRGPHGLLDLWEVRLDDGKLAFVCSAKLGDNWKELGYPQNPLDGRARNDRNWRKKMREQLAVKEEH